MSHDGINFAKSKPTFKKSEHVGNKSEFPELGGDFEAKQKQQASQQTQAKANYGGPVT